MRAWHIWTAAVALLASWPHAASAYRPFDSTDPAVADTGDVEIEVSPVSFRHDDAGQVFIAPELRLNYGFAEDWEVVLEGQAEYSHSGPNTLVENELSVKHVFQEGSLQDKVGPSIAAEFSVLLPGVNDERGTGLMLTGIVGQQWEWGTIHFNAAATLTRDQRAEIFLGAILEGPHDWKVRPVAELVYQRAFGTADEFAALAGAIWQARDKLAFDFAVRRANVAGRPETEIRAGVTFAFAVKRS